MLSPFGLQNQRIPGFQGIQLFRWGFLEMVSISLKTVWAKKQNQDKKLVRTNCPHQFNFIAEARAWHAGRAAGEGRSLFCEYIPHAYTEQKFQWG